MRADRAFGLPIQLDVIYVGKSKNLRRRFLDHTNPWREHNESLNNMGNREKWEFWYLSLPGEEIDRAERKLINASTPMTNHILYRGAKQ